MQSPPTFVHHIKKTKMLRLFKLVTIIGNVEDVTSGPFQDSRITVDDDDEEEDEDDDDDDDDDGGGGGGGG